MHTTIFFYIPFTALYFYSIRKSFKALINVRENHTEMLSNKMTFIEHISLRNC